MGAVQGRESIYNDGSYLDKTGGTWHLEDSPFKVRQIAKMLARHPDFRPGSVCEIGCGAGGILAGLQKILPDDTSFTGYEISAQAHALSGQFSNDRCHFVLGDAFVDASRYDLVLVMDVIEHVEDCFRFLRETKQKGRMKLYHVPLDTHVSSILRGSNVWDSVGHLHLFSIETALKSIEHTGQRVIDWILTDGILYKQDKSLTTILTNLVRVPIAQFSQKLAARLIGGYSMLILAE